jgi:uncharacterized protein
MATSPSAKSTVFLPRRSKRYFTTRLQFYQDPLHSSSEERFMAIGKSEDGRGIFVVFTFRTRRGERLIRPISARYMHKKEMDHDEKEAATPQKR